MKNVTLAATLFTLSLAFATSLDAAAKRPLPHATPDTSSNSESEDEKTYPGLVDYTDSDSDSDQCAQGPLKRKRELPAAGAGAGAPVAVVAAPFVDCAGVASNLSSLDKNLLGHLSSFMTAPDASSFTKTTKQITHEKIIEHKITSIASKLAFPPTPEILTPAVKITIAREIFRLNRQPGETGQYTIPIQSCINRYSSLLTEAINRNDDSAREDLTALVEKLITLFEKPYNIIAINAATILPAGTTRANAQAILAAIPNNTPANTLKRLALCLFWHFNFPGQLSLDPALNLQEAITTRVFADGTRGITIHCNNLPVDLSSEIINFILAIMQPHRLDCHHFQHPQLTINSNTLKILATDHAEHCTTLTLNVNQLEQLVITENRRLAELNVSQTPHINYLDIRNTAINKLNLSHNPMLKNLAIRSCRELAGLDFSRNPLINELEILDCTALTVLDFSHNPLLAHLEVSECTALAHINVTHNPQLQTLFAADCTTLAELNVTHNPLLNGINTEGCVALTELNFAHNPLLDGIIIGQCIALAELDLSHNHMLNNLDIEGCTALTQLDLSHNPALNALNIEGCTALTQLDFSHNPALNTLDIEGCTALTQLNISHCAALHELDVSQNQLLHSLNISGCIGIIELDLFYNEKLVNFWADGSGIPADMLEELQALVTDNRTNIAADVAAAAIDPAAQVDAE